MITISVISDEIKLIGELAKFVIRLFENELDVEDRDVESFTKSILSSNEIMLCIFSILQAVEFDSYDGGRGFGRIAVTRKKALLLNVLCTELTSAVLKGVTIGSRNS